MKKTAMICGVLAAICFGIVGWLFADYYARIKASEARIEALRQQAVPDMHMSSTSPQEVYMTPEEYLEKGYVPYADIFAQNKDMEAWLTIADTKIDYPVMQTVGDENYYIDKDFYGNPDKSGCLILDTESSLKKFGSTNLIIHGHDMMAGTMFGDLNKYRKKSYGQEHNIIRLYTQEDMRVYELISVFYSQIYYPSDDVFKYYEFFRAKKESEFNDFYDNIKKMSLYDTGVTAEWGDSFITLSTCSYHTEDGRFVVIGKEISRQKYNVAE